MNQQWSNIVLEKIPNWMCRGALVTINDDLFQVKRRDFKRNKVWVVPVQQKVAI